MIPAEIASRLGIAELEAQRCRAERNAMLQEVARLLIALQWIVERCDKGGADAILGIRAAASTAVSKTAISRQDP